MRKKLKIKIPYSINNKNYFNGTEERNINFQIQFGLLLGIYKGDDIFTLQNHCILKILNKIYKQIQGINKKYLLVPFYTLRYAQLHHWVRSGSVFL